MPLSSYQIHPFYSTEVQETLCQFFLILSCLQTHGKDQVSVYQYHSLIYLHVSFTTIILVIMGAVSIPRVSPEVPSQGAGIFIVHITILSVHHANHETN